MGYPHPRYSLLPSYSTPSPYSMSRSSCSATPSAPLADPISVPNVKPSTLNQESGPSTLPSSPICLSPSGSPDHGPNPHHHLPTQEFHLFCSNKSCLNGTFCLNTQLQ